MLGEKSLYNFFDLCRGYLIFILGGNRHINKRLRVLSNIIKVSERKNIWILRQVFVFIFQCLGNAVHRSKLIRPNLFRWISLFRSGWNHWLSCLWTTRW